MLEGEPEADREWLLVEAGRDVVGDEFADGVVDGGDLVGVEGVAKSQGVGQDSRPEGEHRLIAAELVVLRDDEREQYTEAPPRAAG
jgi:hypothetical protein